MIRPIIGLDFDDVVAPFNSIACKMANEDLGTTVSIKDITSWENTGKASVIKKYYHDRRLYENQSNAITDESKQAVRELMEFADVYFISAVYPEFMSVRAAQIMEAFPEIPQNRIILGAAKDLVHFDFLLDDNINNVLSSPADYPVLFRKPWNADMTGLLSVNSLNEFVCLVKNVIFPMITGKSKITIPSVIALVGPTGSGKNEVAQKLCQLTDLNYAFVRPAGYTTKPGSIGRTVLTEEEFDSKDFFEKTRYAGYGYGIEKAEIEAILRKGSFPVIPIDICGAIGMKLHFPTIIVYLKRGKCDLVMNIISDHSLSDKEKSLRILSLEAERKNETICDFSFRTEAAAIEIQNLIKNA